MTTEIGRDFRTQIPSLSDDANIQEAFRLYHYGIATEPDEGTPIAALSIESHLKTLSDNIDNIASGQATVTSLDLENLNSVVVSGVYHKANTPLAGYGYPSLNPGLLSVTSTSTGSIYQTYQTLGGVSGTNLRYWRGRSANTTDWSEWKQTSFSGHSHDDRYYTESEIDAKINPLISASGIVVTDSNSRLTTSSVVSLAELAHVDGATSNIQNQLNDRYTKSETARIFVQQSQPSSPQINDLWFW